jgi:UDP-N-acetylglucosamine 2-epimerase (non-hydrolysing)
MKVMVAFGTRPEVIKLAPVILELRRRSVQSVLCTTGQHRDLLPQAMEIFGIVPDVDLATMRPGQSVNHLAGRIVSDLDAILARERPDWVVVQGDTTSALMSGLAAFHRGIRVGHIEAGLRSFDLAAPFPEESNRVLLACLATLHFAPTERAKRNLLAENVDPARILVTGNTVVDAVRYAAGSSVSSFVSPDSAAIPTVVVTSHRREQIGTGLQAICLAVKRLCARYPDHRFVFPIHPNPDVRKQALAELDRITNLSVIDPLPYREMLDLIAGARLIITDSGGIQEEAPSFGVPIVVVREKTERPEAIEAGFATLAGLDPAAIERAAADWLDDPSRSARLKAMANPYGDGDAARRIVDGLFAFDQRREA